MVEINYWTNGKICAKVASPRFFNDLENCLNKAFSKVDNVIVLGDLNINFNVKDSNYDRLKILCEFFDLRNIIKQKTCFAGEQGI